MHGAGGGEDGGGHQEEEREEDAGVRATDPGGQVPVADREARYQLLAGGEVRLRLTVRGASVRAAGGGR